MSLGEAAFIAINRAVFVDCWRVLPEIASIFMATNERGEVAVAIDSSELFDRLHNGEALRLQSCQKKAAKRLAEMENQRRTKQEKNGFNPISREIICQHST
jgi:hypothetical protein